MIDYQHFLNLPPLLAFSRSRRVGIEVNKPCMNFCGIAHHSSSIAVTKSSMLVHCLLITRFFRTAHIFSMMFRSGELAGQSPLPVKSQPFPRALDIYIVVDFEK